MSKSSEKTPTPRSGPHTKSARRWLSALLLLAGSVGFALVLVLNSRASARAGEADAQPSAATLEPQGDFSVFKHDNPAHERLTCLLCHRRETNEPQPRLPGHTPCAGCHMQEFQNAGSNICNICHTDRQTGAMKPFPPLRSFNAQFDHARHTTGVRQSCATCHRPSRRGVALSIPARLGAHSTCFQCHSPRSQASDGRDISSCSTCHKTGTLVRTSENAAAYRVNFSHADHGARARLNCASCHSVRPGATRGRQVTAPMAQMHKLSTRAQSCATCHNDKRAFGTENFANCKRCHEGNSFRFSYLAPFLPEQKEALTINSATAFVRSHDL